MADNNQIPGGSSSQAQGSGPPPTLDQQMGLEDRLTLVRRVPVIEASLIPEPPADYVPLSPEDRGPNLTFLAADQYAESVLALDEIADQGDSTQRDLGPEFVWALIAHALVERMESTRLALARVRMLLEYLETLDCVNRNDAYVHLGRAYSSLVYHQQFHPTLASKYPQLVELMSQRGNRIVQGRARAKKSRQLAAELDHAKQVIEKAGLELKTEGAVHVGRSSSGSDSGSGQNER